MDSFRKSPGSSGCAWGICANCCHKKDIADEYRDHLWNHGSSGSDHRSRSHDDGGSRDDRSSQIARNRDSSHTLDSSGPRIGNAPSIHEQSGPIRALLDVALVALLGVLALPQRALLRYE